LYYLTCSYGLLGGHEDVGKQNEVLAADATDLITQLLMFGFVSTVPRGLSSVLWPIKKYLLKETPKAARSLDLWLMQSCTLASILKNGMKTLLRVLISLGAFAQLLSVCFLFSEHMMILSCHLL
jgi:hypothetical protein